MRKTRSVSKINKEKHDKPLEKPGVNVDSKSDTNSQSSSTLESGHLDSKNLKKKRQLGKRDAEVLVSADGFFQSISKNSSNVTHKKHNGINLKSLIDRTRSSSIKLDVPTRKKLKAIVDLDDMKEQLKQLEDPPISSWDQELSSSRLPYSFFDSPCEQLAQKLLGKILVRHLEDGTVVKGKIVETEGYLGAIDKASHSYQNKVTQRNLPMFMAPGTIYVYMTYGMYHCFNISSQGDGCAVLIRAVEPLEGLEHMTARRNSKSKGSKTKKMLKPHELCNGPSKLCIAFELEKSHSKYSLCSWKGLWVEDCITPDIQIVNSTRIGIDSCGPEWAGKHLRYYIYGNKAVSKRDKKSEEQMNVA